MYSSVFLEDVIAFIAGVIVFTIYCGTSAALAQSYSPDVRVGAVRREQEREGSSAGHKGWQRKAGSRGGRRGRERIGAKEVEQLTDQTDSPARVPEIPHASSHTNTEQHHEGWRCCCFAPPPAAETTTVRGGRGGGSHAGGRTNFVRLTGKGGGAERASRRWLSPPPRPVGSSKPFLLVQTEGTRHPKRVT